MSGALLHRVAPAIAARLERIHAVDFSQPAGESALTPPGSVTWQVFDNHVALFAGGVAAVILELAEPRVRSGVWDHTTFRCDPLGRMERTGLAAMVTVYAARSRAENMIAGVRRMHERVRGTTKDGVPYHANDPELLDWVQATASFGFLEAYRAYARALTDAERDRFYADGVEAARLYGAVGAPATRAQLEALFAAMTPKLERSEVVFEFLEIMRRTSILPGPLRPLQWMMVRAGVELVPAPIREILDLDASFGLRAFERRLVRAFGWLADRVHLPSSPARQARRRLGSQGGPFRRHAEATR